jgi:hypothetical protein
MLGLQQDMLLCCLENIENLWLILIPGMDFIWLVILCIVIFYSLHTNPIIGGWCDAEASELI